MQNVADGIIPQLQTFFFWLVVDIYQSIHIISARLRNLNYSMTKNCTVQGLESVEERILFKMKSAAM